MPAYCPYTFQPMLSIDALVSLFHYKSPRNFRFEGESHDFWELVYIDQGQMLITAGRAKYVLKAGELAFHMPGEYHTVEAVDNSPANFIIAAFCCDSPCMTYFEHKLLSLNGQERETLYEAVSHCRLAFSGGQTPHALELTPDTNAFPGHTQLVKLELERLLLSLLQRGESTRVAQRAESYEQRTRNTGLTDEVLAYLEAHVSESLTLTQIASALGYSVSQMKKLFRQRMNRGIMDYFIDLKLDEAKRLMREGTLSISQVAAVMGYDNPAYFSRLFKRRCDMTPTEFCRSYGM